MRLYATVFTIATLALAAAASAQLLVPQYDSHPGAPATLYLTFTGDFTSDWDGYHPNTTPAYDIDGDPTTFSQTELDNIHQIWARVSEKYSPFNLNVTTAVAPATLNNFESYKVVVGG